MAMRSPLYEQQREAERASGLIVITPEHNLNGEIEVLKKICQEGVYRVHIRKPRLSKSQLRGYLKELCQRVDPSLLTIHYDRDLACEFALGGLHGAEELSQEGDSFIRSCSCHTIEELKCAEEMDYMFLSPIFNSISKHGYEAAFDMERLIIPSNRRVVALGGVDASNIESIADREFFSAALLGAIWGASEELPIEESISQFTNINGVWRERLKR